MAPIQDKPTGADADRAPIATNDEDVEDQSTVMR
jgi:hypothetical protein